VSREAKARLHAIAQDRGATESELLKKLVDVALLQSTGMRDLTVAEPVGAVSRNARVFVRLRPEDHTLLRERASGRGMAGATYASIILRTHLGGVARIPDREFAELKRAVAELGAIGRNLNQIARLANETRRVSGPSTQDLQAVLRACTALRDRVKELLHANTVSWETSHAEAPRR
jgi:Bacterial mobilisation protein (MobC)